MPKILDYKNSILNFINKPGRSVWAKDLVAAAVLNKGQLTDEQIMQINHDIVNGAIVPTYTLPNKIGSVIPKVELKELKHIKNVNRLASNQTITFCQEGITVLFGYNGSGKSGYFRIINKLAGGSIGYSILQDIYANNPQQMSVEVKYSEDGNDKVQTWDFNAPFVSPLVYMRVFDGNYANIIIHERESNTALFDSLGLEVYRGIYKGLEKLSKLGCDLSSDENDIRNLCTANYSNKLVTALENQFKEELKALGMDYLSVSLEMADILNPISKIRLTITNDHDLSNVLSEAELKCCALALFIAECELQEVQQPMVFDDPVNSLDASLIGLFAQRLIMLDCPVVIFTHNTQLLTELLNSDQVKVYDNPTSVRVSAKRRALVYEILRESHNSVGYVLSYKEIKSKFYLNKAKDILDNAIPLTRQDQKDVVDNLRFAVECIVDEVFFRGLVPNRFRGCRDKIKWSDLEIMLAQNSNDVKATHTIYNKLSSCGLHLGMAQQVAPLTKPQLLSFYTQLKALIDNAGI